MVSEAEWEAIAFGRLLEHGWETLHGHEIAPGTEGGRNSWDDVVLRGRLLDAMRGLNPLVPTEYLEQALAEIVAPTSQDAIAENYRLHQILVHGYRGISYVDADGIEQTPTIRLVSHLVEENGFLAVNQVTVRSTEVERRFDVVLYLNGMPVVIVELKKAGAEQADLASAHAQLATYLREFPTAFRCCVLSVISDGITARYGTPFTPLNHYSPWNVDDDGLLLVAYAPLADNLSQALAEYTDTDRAERPVGRNVDEAAGLARSLIETLDAVCSGYPWRQQLVGDAKSWIKAARGLTNHLRSPSTPGNQVGDGEQTLAQRFRKLANQLARAWALAAGSETLADLRTPARFYEEVRVWMAKFDAQERQACGEPVPEEIQLLLSGLVASSTATGEIVDIYEAAGLPRPSLSDLGPEFRLQAQQAENPHLAIEALRDLLTAESAKLTRHNLVRQRAFSERIKELMNRYTNQQLTSAEVIAELIEMAREVAAEANRGKHFTPPLSEDELAFYDAVSTNESAVTLQGEDVLAQIARELVAVMRRDVKTDWMVRDDVRAKLRSSIKRLLVKYRYPPDKQPDAIRLVIEQMEAMAPRYTV